MAHPLTMPEEGTREMAALLLLLLCNNAFFHCCTRRRQFFLAINTTVALCALLVLWSVEKAIPRDALKHIWGRMREREKKNATKC